jgi:hypothetical protein
MVSIKKIIPYLLLLAVSCSNEEKSLNIETNLNQTMQSVQNTARKLFLYTWTTEDSLSDSDSKEVLKLVKELRTDFHKIDNDKTSKSQEIGFKSILNQQNKLLAEIQDNLENKNYEYAKWKLKGITHNCFMCHSRVPALQDKISQKIVINDSTFESRIAEIEYLVASRQFSKAEHDLYNLASDLSKNEFSQSSSLDSLRLWILLQVRVRGDFVKASHNLATILNDGKFSIENKIILNHWISDLIKISQENFTQERYTNTSSDEKLKLIVELLGATDRKNTENEDDLNLVRSIFASSLLHQLHYEASDIKKTQQILALLGISYSRINIPSLKSLSPNYYTECIEILPKTKWAKICFKNWEKDFEYLHTGSSGLRLTKEDLEKINHLKSLTK